MSAIVTGLHMLRPRQAEVAGFVRKKVTMLVVGPAR